MRLEGPDGATDRIGLVLAIDADTLALEDRQLTVHRIDRSQIRLAKLVPTVARGRNPRHAPTDLLRRLAADESLEPAGGVCWIARLCDLVDHLDDSGVHRLSPTSAAYADSRGLVNGEWAALSLKAAADLVPLAAWAARHNARNVVLTSPLPETDLSRLGLEPVDDG